MGARGGGGGSTAWPGWTWLKIGGVVGRWKSSQRCWTQLEMGAHRGGVQAGVSRPRGMSGWSGRTNPCVNGA